MRFSFVARYISLNSDELVSLPIAPCILPELVNLKAVILNDPNYWPVCFEKGKNWDQLEYVWPRCIDGTARDLTNTLFAIVADMRWPTVFALISNRRPDVCPIWKIRID